MSTPITHQYHVKVAWDAQRKGILSSNELPNTITVATPPEFNGGMPGIWSPEHYFVAAANSCLMTTFLALAENFKLPYSSFESQAYGKLELVEGKYMISEITLEPLVVVPDDELIEKAFKVLHKSEANCLISNSMKSAIRFHPKVQVKISVPA